LKPDVLHNRHEHNGDDEANPRGSSCDATIDRNNQYGGIKVKIRLASSTTNRLREIRQLERQRDELTAEVERLTRAIERRHSARTFAQRIRKRSSRSFPSEANREKVVL